MTKKLLTRGQLERQIAQTIQGFYRSHLGHKPSKVTCQFFETKLAIVVENAVTSAEKILLEEGQEDLAIKVHVNLENSLKSELKKIVADIAMVEVVDILSDTTLSTGRTGMIAILEQTPEVCNPESIPKVKR